MENADWQADFILVGTTYHDEYQLMDADYSHYLAMKVA